MRWKIILAVLLLGVAAGCGTKSDLVPPDGKPQHGDKHNPSQPPAPIGQ